MQKNAFEFFDLHAKVKSIKGNRILVRSSFQLDQARFSWCNGSTTAVKET